MAGTVPGMAIPAVRSVVSGTMRVRRDAAPDAPGRSDRAKGLFCLLQPVRQVADIPKNRNGRGEKRYDIVILLNNLKKGFVFHL